MPIHLVFGVCLLFAGETSPLADRYPFVEADDVRGLPMRMHSLLADEFTFFRGSDDEFYRFAAAACSDWIADRDSRVLLHGDVHIGNVGTYWAEGEGNAPTLRFGVVDPDEVVRGPFQLDLLRALTGMRFAALSQHAALTHGNVTAAAEALVAGSRQAVSGVIDNDAIVRSEPRVASLLTKAV